MKKGKEYSITLTKEQVKEFTKNKIYIETVNTIDNREIKGLEEASIITFGKAVNEKINDSSETERLSIIELIGEQNLSDFNFVVKLYDRKSNNIVKTYEEMDVNTTNPNRKTFTAAFEDLKISDYRVEIEVVDIHNNALVTDDKIGNIIQTGIYIKGKNKFYDEFPKIVLNYRYQFGIKFIVSSETDLVLQCGNGISLDLRNCELYKIETNQLTDSSKQFKMEKDNSKAVYHIDNVEFGKEYLLVFDFKLHSLIDVNNIKFNINLGGNINKNVLNIVPEPKID